MITGTWAHYEDAKPGDIAWYRHRLPYPYRGTTLITGPGLRYEYEPEPWQEIIDCDSPRDVIVALLLAGQWGRQDYDIRSPIHGEILHGTGQDYYSDGHWCHIPAVGSVRIYEDVEVGAQATIEIGTLGYTTLDHGVRIGHHCMIGHDVRIERDAIVIAGARIAGWARIGAKAKINMGALIRNGVVVGEEATIGMGAVVVCDVPAGETWVGNPARRMR